MNLVGIIVILRIKVEILTALQGFRKEMQETYVLREVYDRDHPKPLPAHHR
jgi:hypothetical protein